MGRARPCESKGNTSHYALGVIDLYPEGTDRKKAVSDAEKAKQSLLVTIRAYDTARMEYNDYIKKYAQMFDSPKKEWTTTSHEIVEWAYKYYNKERMK